MAGINLKPVFIEMWIEYAIGILVLCLRIYGRVAKVVGWKWQGDDYLAVSALTLFTWEVAMCQVIVYQANKGSITGMTNEIALSLSPEQYHSHETGAKWLFGAWKTLPEERLVKWASVVVVVSYLATLGVITGHCWPTYRLWQVYPYPGDDCSQNRSKYYALVTTNVLKLIFGLMFCGGFFIIICTLMRCIICLHTPERLDLGLSWSIRETFIGIICTNAPSIKPLFHRRNKSGITSSGNSTGLITIGGTGRSLRMSRLQRIPDETGTGSQENIIDTVGGKNQTVVYADDQSSHHTAQYGSNIHVSREYRVDDHSS
ncbi:Kinesin-like protein [Fusarium austroafricanum]|uniref:Kinesin-like protein n=1 Tax=Fusarium austroafricanum TaxID=2364996 RepID=A0A8H4JAB9_9HYPO|nr:Kinesin-like protein [Fusarium austroafricanum]